MQGQAVEYCAEMLHKLWASGESYRDIAAALGCSESYVHKLKVRHRLPNRQRPTREIFQNDPTPEEIAERAAEIKQRHMQQRKAECAQASMSRGSHHRLECDYGIRRYGWDGYSFSAIG